MQSCCLFELRADDTPLSSASGTLAVVLSNEGEITSITMRNAKGESLQRSVSGRSIIAGTTSSDKQSETVADGGVRFRRNISSSAGQAVVTETFRPGDDQNSIIWELEIAGSGAPWSTSIQTYLELLHNENDFRFWSAWTRSDLPQHNGYANPLEPMDFTELHMIYGGNGGSTKPTLGFSVPIASWHNSQMDLGLSLVQSPFDFVQDMKLHTSPVGSVNFERTSLRISDQNIIRVEMCLAVHPADWRSGMGFLVGRYPEAFNPHSEIAHAVGGGGTYADYRGEDVDFEKFRKMGFSMNWSATFPWPYIGMSIPPVKSNDESWPSIGGTENSGHVIVSTSMCANVMNSYGTKMREQGFHQLEYFTVTEAGNFISPTPTERAAVEDADLWRSANDFIYHQIPNANLGIASWLQCRVVDPGDPAWKTEIIRQITDICIRLPQCSGVVIDRMDWLSRFNSKGDDGVTWTGTPKRSLLHSWHQVMEQMISVTKAHNKVVFGNVQDYRRLDAMRHLDGVYNENRSGGIHNLIAIAGVRKPVVTWGSPNNDAGFQEYLYLGIFPSLPFPKANHNTLPNAELESWFLDYGPMLNAIRGKRWVLLPHVLKVESGNALANIFEVDDGYVIPIVFGGVSLSARITLKNLPMGDLNALEAIYPGNNNWVRLMDVDSQGSFSFDVPLHRGCAMVRLTKSPRRNGEMVYNGGFERPLAPTSAYLPWGTKVDGWMTKNCTYPPLVASENFSSAFPSAPEGVQWGLIDFRADYNGGGSLLQLIGLVHEGQKYNWKIVFGNRSDVGYMAPFAFGLYSLSNNVLHARSVKHNTDVTMPQRGGSTQTFDIIWDSSGTGADGEPLYFKMDLPTYSGSSTAQLLIDALSVSCLSNGTALSICSRKTIRFKNYLIGRETDHSESSVNRLYKLVIFTLLDRAADHYVVF